MVTADVALFSGGSWHDFPKFESYAARWVKRSRHRQLRGLAPRELVNLAEHGAAIAMLYTCFDEHTDLDHDERELQALDSWLERGGRLLALHASSVAANRHPRLARLLGGRFVSHPPKARFLVSASAEDDPLASPICPFEIEDERYELEFDSRVRVHLTARADDRLLPLAWSRSHGLGKVIYVALGHDESSWELPAYESLMVRALDALM